MEKLVKVLHLVRNIEYEGGAEIFLRSFIRSSLKSVQVGLYCIEGGGNEAEKLKDLGVEVIAQKNNWFNPITAWNLKRFLDKRNYDVVHSHLFNADFVAGVLNVLKPNQLVVSTKYCMESRFTETNTLVERILTKPLCDTLLERFASRRNNEIYAVSSPVAKKWGGMSRDISQVSVIPCSPHRLSDISPKKSYSLSKRIKVGTFVRLVPEKGVIEGIEAIDLARREEKGLEWHIYGGGFLKRKIEEEIERRALSENIILRGHISNKTISTQELKSLDLYFHPSRSEGLSIAIQEAMIAGLPIISTDVGGSSDMVYDGNTGLLCPPQNPQKMAEKIILLLSSSEEYRRNLGLNAKRLAQATFNLDVATEKYVRAYRGLVL